MSVRKDCFINWIKYFLLVVFAIFLYILIIINNEKVSIDNKKISSFTKTQNFLLNQQAKLDELKLIIAENENEKFPIKRINMILEEIGTEFVTNPLLGMWQRFV